MKDTDTSATDRRFRIGLAISLGSLLLMGIGLFAVVSALTTGGVKLPDQGSLSDIVGDNSTSTDAPGGQTAPEGFPDGPKPVRLVIPRIYVDAPIVELGIQPGTDYLAVPDTGYQAGWYDINPPPGVGYNALFSGHVDWQTADHQPIPGVFYRLRELQIGDDIDVALENGSTVAYRVTGNVATAYNDPNLSKALEPSPKDVITLLTCGGDWISNPADAQGGNYSHRIIVRAERVVSSGAG